MDHKETVAKLKAGLLDAGLDPYHYQLKDMDGELNLCVGRDNPDFDEGGKGELVMQDIGFWDVCADVHGAGVKRVSWS